jgi:hypothetical protein
LAIALCGCGSDDGDQLGKGGSAGQTASMGGSSLAGGASGGNAAGGSVSGGSASGGGVSGGSASGGGVSGGSASGGGGALVNKGAISLELSETTCLDQTKWAVPDAAAPVTATQRGTLAADQGPFSDAEVHCLVQHLDSGKWDISGMVTMNRGKMLMNVFATVDPAAPSPGGIQLAGTNVGKDVSSTDAGPCLFTFLDVTEGKVWGKVACETTRDRDMTECGPVTIYYALDDCYKDRVSYNSH